MPSTFYQLLFIGRLLLILSPFCAGTYGGITHIITNIATVVSPTLTGYLVVAYQGYSAMFVGAAIVAVMG